MKKLLKRSLVCLAVALVVPAGSFAGTYAGQDPPNSLLVERNGWHWAWASPCSPENPSCDPNVPLQMHHGFSVASEKDWLRDFLDLTDVYDAFNPAGQPQLNAAPYFSSPYDHVDAVNISGEGGVCSNRMERSIGMGKHE